MSQLSIFDGDLPKNISTKLYKLCAEIPPENIPDLKQDIHHQVTHIQQALAYNEFIDVDTARRVAKILMTLLEDYTHFNFKQRALINGAARYFSTELDAKPDTGSILGLDDDVLVLNFVLDQIGLSDKKVDY